MISIKSQNAVNYWRMMLDTGQAQEATLTLEHLQQASGPSAYAGKAVHS